MHSTEQQADLGRLRWRCRRGMKELDLLLGRWLERSYAQASSRERQLFAEFLELPDPVIAGYLLAHAAPEDLPLRALVAGISADPD